MKKILLSLLVLASLPAYSQQYRASNSSEIIGQLNQLKTLGTVMYIAAHPDDENTRLISYLVHERNVRTIYLSLTRGDGGQNIIGSEQGVSLGLIRTLEMNEARKMDGAEQLYTSAIDFGFTKNPEEVFTLWNKQQLIDEVKFAIQATQPNVLIMRFPTTGEGGHGQHTASAIIAVEAYEQLKTEAKTNKKTWIPERLLFNAFNFGERSTQKEDQLKIDINQYNPLLGKSYGELAGQSRSMHKSQGAGTPQSFGVYQEYFQHIDGNEAKVDMFDNIDLTWKSVGAPNIAYSIDTIINSFNPQAPDQSIAALIKLKKSIKALKPFEKQEYQLALLDEIILSCAGITAEYLTTQPSYTKGEKIKGTMSIATRAKNVALGGDINNSSLITEVDNKKNNLKFPLKKDQLFQQDITLQANFEYDNPYWLNGKSNNYHFDTTFNQSLGMPINRTKSLNYTLYIQDEPFTLQIPIAYKRLDPLRGDVINEIRIEPEISVAPVNGLLFVDESKTTNTLLQIKTNKSVNNVTIWGTEIKGISSKSYVRILNIPYLRAHLDTIIDVKLPKELLNGININYNITISESKDTFDITQKVITYDHLPETQYLVSATQKLVEKNWTNKATNIGYIQGADDMVDDVLKALNINVTNLNWNDFQNAAAIQKLDAIVVGIRAYNVNNEIAAIQPLLMQYVKNGGTLIVQYNTDKNLKIKDLGPYPFQLSRKRITEENAEVRITKPEHKLLQNPNKITVSDFQDWVQERGIYYPTNWDSRYETLISSNDNNEVELEGNILYTPYGKGHFIYTPLVFFRQLPDGNTGAIKLFLNLLSVGK